MRIVLGVGGGIAAYKSAELTRALQQNGHTVQVVLTEAAGHFIQPLTFAALTGRKVITGLFSSESADSVLSSAVEHIGVAQENDALVVAPATADLLSKFANGAANDFLSTLYLAFTGPVLLAPAMNTAMWNHPATQENLQKLRARGHIIIDPNDGWLACGTIGAGRMAEPAQIAEAIQQLGQTKRDLEGEVVLVTAGPTQEPLDPVRYIGNRSSGKMGYAIAQAALKRGAKVILISGPVHISAPPQAEMIPVQTAAEMHDAVMRYLPESTIIVKAAAVADYRLSDVPQQKMKKTAARLSLNFDPTPDILAEVGQKKEDRLLIGFAAETEHLAEEAKRKMISKNCDMVVGNLVNREGTVFGSDFNEVLLVLRTGETIPIEKASKEEVSERILDQVMKLRLASHQAAAQLS